MRVFKEPNLSSGWKCPICGTDEKKEVVLIGIMGTQEGRNIQAEQFHIDCIDPMFYINNEKGMIGRVFEYKGVGNGKESRRDGE